MPLKEYFRKYMNTSNEQREQEIRERLNLMYPTEEEKLLGLMTMYGMCASFTLYLSEFMDIFKHSLPESILYAISVSSTNLVALTAPEPEVKFESKKFKLLENMNEQHEEVLIRRIKEMIVNLYNHFELQDL
jgi:hypothetical protein